MKFRSSRFAVIGRAAFAGAALDLQARRVVKTVETGPGAPPKEAR